MHTNTKINNNIKGAVLEKLFVALLCPPEWLVVALLCPWKADHAGFVVYVVSITSIEIALHLRPTNTRCFCFAYNRSSLSSCSWNIITAVGLSEGFSSVNSSWRRQQWSEGSGGSGRWNVVAAEIVGSALDRTMPPSAQTNGKRVDGMMGGAEGAEAVEGQIRPWL